ncbi:tRNA (adenosine(37)-N6)-threonylcarbamoyltransferase complex dimerization subunit type 1 TsaB [Lentilactobacillus laojiaonis]|uniref:tRNA (adenosine(37)-N6)-threonylcarbamoyltransferase complex dimerization subunit type 1 TsaB n=1 Tax=Lentilactobacillus laojiaonis TaxID=2883998 RepID=UPI001D09E636|nr:tRNA (adenosine(37)-N6)-threonylcarbamoyltransferase complex dimerization subunit type 1 TsaB [Lentilactobacillus laojiaonis]UDM31848.1 tRNA (adenosine(37)-N6)-threonylcarbamoyltransferase complex dimerization subunit type 1 TsaB [Lentilactobacillus laojiaonis]
MKTLAIDTSNQPLSIAVLDGNELLTELTMTTHKKHAEFINGVIADLVKKANLQPSDLDRIVVAEGPGSYTGIRMAVTVAKTLSMTLNIELVMVSSLLSLSLNVDSDKYLINPIFDGRNNNMFTGLYQRQQGKLINVIEDQHTNVDDWLKKLKNFDQPIIILGQTESFIDTYKKTLNNQVVVANSLTNIPRAAKMGIYSNNLEPVNDINSVVPKYLRLTKAEADWQKLHPKEGDENYVEKI